MDNNIPIWFNAGGGSPTGMPPLESITRPKRKTPTTPTNVNRGTGAGAGSGFDPRQPRGSDGKWVQTGMGQYTKPRPLVVHGPTRLTRSKKVQSTLTKNKRSRTSRWERVSRLVWIVRHFKRWIRNKRRMQARQRTKQWMAGGR